jgi:hypothetical protein
VKGERAPAACPSKSHLNLLKRDLEGEAFVIVRIQGALFDTGFLFFEPLPGHDQRDLDVRI